MLMPVTACPYFISIEPKLGIWETVIHISFIQISFNNN